MKVAALLAGLVPTFALAEIEVVYVCPMSHTDVGFTAAPRTIAERSVDFAYKALELARKDPAYVWTFEVFWQFEQLLDPQHPTGLPASKTPASQPAASRPPITEEILELVRAGRFGIGGAYVNAHTSLMSGWMLNELFRIPAEWGRRHGLTLDWAVINDMPGHPADLPSFMMANGVRYLALGVNQSLSKPLPVEVCNMPFWWQAPDGRRVLTWISDTSYAEAWAEYGIDPGTARFFNPSKFAGLEAIDIVRQGMASLVERYKQRKYPYDAAMIMHAYDNWDPGAAARLPEVVRTWNESGGKPRLQLATPGQFLRHLDEKYGPDLPVLRGGFGGQWEIIRTAAVTAMARARAYEQHLRESAAPPDPTAIRRLLLYWEHSYAMGVPWPGLLAQQEALEQNRQQWDMVADWPLPKMDDTRGKPVRLPAVKGQSWQSNMLLMARKDAILPNWQSLEPLPEDAWLDRSSERLDEQTLRCRQRVDREKLPYPVHVFWIWKLEDSEATAPVVINTPGGTTRYPNGNLAGYEPGHWIAPFGFRIGTTAFDPHGPFVFARLPEHPGWLVAYVLSQNRAATFRGGEKAVWSLAEAYPGEEPVYDMVIDVRTMDPTKQSAAPPASAESWLSKSSTR